MMTGTDVTTRTTPLSPSTFAEAVKFAEMMASSTMVPADYRGKPANVLLALQYGAELGLAPLQAMQSIAVINGRPSVYGDALLAIATASPLCEDVIERFEGAGDTLTAVCEARRRGRTPVVRTFSVSAAKRAGLWGKSGPWSQYPRRMLQHRARGFALRDAFPDLLRGLISVEEAQDTPARQMIDVTPPAEQPPLSDDLDVFAAERAANALEELTDAAPDIEEVEKAPFVDAPAEEPTAPSAAAPDTDLLGDPPASDDLYVPLPRRPTPGDLEYFGRQLLNAIAEDRSRQRLARLRLANEGGIGQLKALPDLYGEVMQSFAQRSA